MAEREIYNPETGQYELIDDDGIYETNLFGQSAPVAPPPETVAPPTTVTPPGGTAPPKVGDRRVSRPGFYEEYDGTKWVEYSDGVGAGGPPPSGTTTGGTSTTMDPAYDASGFSWPIFNAPTYTPGPAFQAPKPFEFESFKAPEFSDIYKDGSFIGRRDEGLQAIEHGAAAKGLSRLPQTLKALAGWNQDYASREYGNIFDRSASTYDRNRNNAADTYSLNYGVSRDVWDRGENQNLTKFDRDYRGASDMFDFNEWKPASATFDDLFRRYKAELDANTAIATAGAGL